MIQEKVYNLSVKFQSETHSPHNSNYVVKNEGGFDAVNLESINEYLKWEEGKGISETSLRKQKCYVMNYSEWTNEEEISVELLKDWRKSLEDKGYSSATVQNYVKGINRYLEFRGLDHLKFTRGKQKDIKGKVFGSLEVLECTNRLDRNNYVWKCRCKCGKIVELPATRLLTGNTTSCGCVKMETLEKANMYIENTSLRQVFSNQTESKTASSGYIGVTKKRNKWQAYINYQGKRYFLGCFDELEDAFEARKRAKEKIQEKAQELYLRYQEKLEDSISLKEREKETVL